MGPICLLLLLVGAHIVIGSRKTSDHGQQGELDNHLPCYFNGEIHNHGDSYMSPDGCNDCSCIAGRTTCTYHQCPDGGSHVTTPDSIQTPQPSPLPPRQSTAYPFYSLCTFNGRDYYPGSIVPLSDGCSYCICVEYGQLADCNHERCLPIAGSCHADGQTFDNGESFQAADGCTLCECLHGRITCSSRFCQGGASQEQSDEWYMSDEDTSEEQESNSRSSESESMSSESESSSSESKSRSSDSESWSSEEESRGSQSRGSTSKSKGKGKSKSKNKSKSREGNRRRVHGGRKIHRH